ncbi:MULTISPECIES: hypothetical protein [unclassified Moorena]|uniref:hypothetical protein n=1 Tax=unclassified Moorena TaxID=2683338 RepID=UPI0025EC9B8F|nr:MULTISPECIES: hypothetical protein [unclassified Moorena]
MAQALATLREWPRCANDALGGNSALFQCLLVVLMQSASGGNHGSRSWGEPPRPRCLPKTVMVRFP